MRRAWPSWWDWELLLSNHVLRRMSERGFDEIDLRAMLASAERVRWGSRHERWVVATRHLGRSWEIVIELDDATQRLIVVTAYPVDSASR